MLVAISCANRAQGPGGGPKDETPPRIVRSVPDDGTLNYSKKTVQVYFDENIQLDKVQDNVVISPVQQTPPDIRANGKLLSVNFQDDLIDSTTYSIHFGDAVVDLNERNALKNFNFSFSTGSVIDTLGFSGYLLQADNLEPVAKVLIGVHSQNSDSAIFETVFDRISKTDEHGHFEINNLKAGSYRLFALGDVNRDYMYQTGENVAFLDSLISPYSTREMRADTLWRDSIRIDTVRMVEKTINHPQNVVLRYFKDARKRQYLVKSDRPEPSRFQLLFNTKQEKLPEFQPLNFNKDSKYLLQSNLTNDSLVYWLKDTSLYFIDTLSVVLKYQITDSIWNLVPKTDTVRFVNRKINKTSKNNVIKIKRVEFKSNISQTFDLNKSIALEFSTPVDTIIMNKLRLYHLVDSTRKELNYDFVRLDSVGLKFKLHQKWLAQNSYELIMDSAAVYDIFGNVNETWSSPFKIKALEEYSAIKIKLTDPDTLGVLQIVDLKESVIQEQKVGVNGNLFEYLKPDSYYVKMYIDENQNSLWDAGSLLNKMQPEKVYFLTKKLTLKANWEVEEEWNHNETPILKQRPLELRKDIKKQDPKLQNKQGRQ